MQNKRKEGPWFQFHFLIQVENVKMLKDSFPLPLNKTPHHIQKKSASHEPMTGELVSRCIFKRPHKEKEILENMNDLRAGETCLRPLNYEQYGNRCQKCALILITLLPLCVPGYESDSLTPLHCINSRITGTMCSSYNTINECL